MAFSAIAYRAGMVPYVQKRRVGLVANATFLLDRHTRAAIVMLLDPCQSSPCGALGKCIPTNQAQIPYYCQCPDGQNTMFKCADPSRCCLCLGELCDAGTINTFDLLLPCYRWNACIDLTRSMRAEPVRPGRMRNHGQHPERLHLSMRRRVDSNDELFDAEE
jgi:hypothetical protein